MISLRPRSTVIPLLLHQCRSTHKLILSIKNNGSCPARIQDFLEGGGGSEGQSDRGEVVAIITIYEDVNFI